MDALRKENIMTPQARETAQQANQRERQRQSLLLSSRAARPAQRRGPLRGLIRDAPPRSLIGERGGGGGATASAYAEGGGGEKKREPGAVGRWALIGSSGGNEEVGVAWRGDGF